MSGLTVSGSLTCESQIFCGSPWTQRGSPPGLLLVSSFCLCWIQQIQTPSPGSEQAPDQLTTFSCLPESLQTLWFAFWSEQQQQQQRFPPQAGFLWMGALSEDPGGSLVWLQAYTGLELLLCINHVQCVNVTKQTKTQRIHQNQGQNSSERIHSKQKSNIFNFAGLQKVYK